MAILRVWQNIVTWAGSSEVPIGRCLQRPQLRSRFGAERAKEIRCPRWVQPIDEADDHTASSICLPQHPAWLISISLGAIVYYAQ